VNGDASAQMAWREVLGKSTGNAKRTTAKEVRPRALARLSKDANPLVLEEVKETRGLGLVGRIGREVVALGRVELFDELGVQHSAPPSHDKSIAGLGLGAKFLGWMLLADQPPEARVAIAGLRQLGLEGQSLLTGDRVAVARRVADLLRLQSVRAGALPAQKMSYVLDEINSGYRPMVAGDGMNDSLALKVGAVGIAMGAQGSDVALASADLV
jgi:Zn2+/Cd2+-exporting ATPase